MTNQPQQTNPNEPKYHPEDKNEINILCARKYSAHLIPF